MSSIPNVLEKLKYSIFLRIVFDAIAKAGLRITPYYVVREGLWGNGIFNLEKKIEGYEFRLINDEQMRTLSRIPGWEVSEPQLIQRLKDGHICLGLVKDGEVAAFNWANPRESSGSLCRFPLKEDEAYLYDAYTVYAYRGKQLAPCLRYLSYRYLSELGMPRLYSISDAFNTPSIKFKKKLKAQFVKLGVSIKFIDRYECNLTLWQAREFKQRLISADRALPPQRLDQTCGKMQK